MVAVTRAHVRLTSHRLAEIVGTPKKNLLAALEAEGFPPPQNLLAWGRLIVAAQMLEDPNRAADAVRRLLILRLGVPQHLPGARCDAA
jgi:hypothetical protein